ncbi:hypothetical protein A2412_01290 [Candidatus Peribacteria bacterium RIFOXYC1_FULL_58_8]|nr:MAG: hypothetical protein A2412_01290 [Candidatus Peribacteria bacterium RIFOXYC1_FULL_58_8]
MQGAPDIALMLGKEDREKALGNYQLPRLMHMLVRNKYVDELTNSSLSLLQSGRQLMMMMLF